MLSVSASRLFTATAAASPPNSKGEGGRGSGPTGRGFQKRTHHLHGLSDFLGDPTGLLQHLIRLQRREGNPMGIRPETRDALQLHLHQPHLLRVLLQIAHRHLRRFTVDCATRLRDKLRGFLE